MFFFNQSPSALLFLFSFCSQVIFFLLVPTFRHVCCCIIESFFDYVTQMVNSFINSFSFWKEIDLGTTLDIIPCFICITLFFMLTWIYKSNQYSQDRHKMGKMMFNKMCMFSNLRFWFSAFLHILFLLFIFIGRKQRTCVNISPKPMFGCFRPI